MRIRRLEHVARINLNRIPAGTYHNKPAEKRSLEGPKKRRVLKRPAPEIQEKRKIIFAVGFCRSAYKIADNED